VGAPIGVDGIGARLAATVAEAALLVLLVVLPAAFNPAGVLAFEPLKASLLRCTAVLIGVLWLWGRLGRQDQSIDVGLTLWSAPGWRLLVWPPCRPCSRSTLA